MKIIDRVLVVSPVDYKAAPIDSIIETEIGIRPDRATDLSEAKKLHRIEPYGLYVTKGMFPDVKGGMLKKNYLNLHNIISRIVEEPDFIVFTWDPQIAEEARRNDIVAFEVGESREFASHIRKHYRRR